MLIEPDFQALMDACGTLAPLFAEKVTTRSAADVGV